MSNTSDVAQNVISLPKGGGAIKGIGETFQPNLFSGTGNHAIPLAMSPGRNGFGPTLALAYSSGNGNGLFGLGWQLAIPRITRKTEKGLPTYDDSDVFVFDRATGINTLVSHDSNSPSVTGLQYSFAPSISPDGNFIAYYSAATDLIARSISC